MTNEVEPVTEAWLSEWCEWAHNVYTESEVVLECVPSLAVALDVVRDVSTNGHGEYQRDTDPKGPVEIRDGLDVIGYEV